MACGYPRDAAAVLLIELDGLRDGMDDMADRITRICKAQQRPRRAGGQGRGRAGDALARPQGQRSGPSPGWRPTTCRSTARCRAPCCPRRCAGWPRSAAGYDLPDRERVHAGDGNLHPAASCSTAGTRPKEKVEAAGMEVLRRSARTSVARSAASTASASRSWRPCTSSSATNDLRAQCFVKDAFDPRGLCNPGKLLPPDSRPARRRRRRRRGACCRRPRCGGVAPAWPPWRRDSRPARRRAGSMRTQATSRGAPGRRGPRLEPSVLALADARRLARVRGRRRTKLDWGNPPAASTCCCSTAVCRLLPTSMPTT